MPLLKRTPFSLMEPPNDMNPDELVFQVRFTKEIFRDYQEYVKRINLYRQRLWTCKVTGKTNLTYEEALVSEQRAAEKVQKFPQELLEAVLRTVQYSMLGLGDLVRKIRTDLQERLVEGVELHGKKGGYIHPCKIVKVLGTKDNKARYEVAWLTDDDKTDETAMVGEEDLIRKKLPFGSDVLKSIIRESTYRSLPWVVHNNLTLKYGIPTDPPEDLKCKISFLNGCVISKRKRTNEEGNAEKHKRNKLETDNDVNNGSKSIKYPIDDKLVRPAVDDPIFTDRPSPIRDFNVPSHCIGDLLMVWDFCSSFGKMCNLLPYSLEDFEKAICHQDSNLALIVETHIALLHLLVKEQGEYYTVLQEKKRRQKITLVMWMEYLCDFVEMIGTSDLSAHIPTIKRGHYGLLDPSIKLRILRELVDQVLATDLMRDHIDDYLERRREIAASKRGEAADEGKKKKEAKECLRADSEANGVVLKHNSDIMQVSSGVPGNNGHRMTNGNHVDKISTDKSHPLVNGKSDKQGNELKDKSRKLLEELERSKKQRKEFVKREIEKLVIQTNPLGKDRDYNRYWFFRRDGRIFVESLDSKQWGYYSSNEELDALIGSLNPKGERELALRNQLASCYTRICKGLQKRSKENAHKLALEDGVVRRSSRVRAPPKDNPALAYLNYRNTWKALMC